MDSDIQGYLNNHFCIINTDANSVLEVVNADFNTTTNTPLPTIVGDDQEDVAHLLLNNGSAYFKWNGTGWVFAKFVSNSLPDIPDASALERGLVNTDITTAQQLGNGNKIIKGASTGNPFEVKQANGNKIFEVKTSNGITINSNSFSDRLLTLYNRFYSKESSYFNADGTFKLIFDVQNGTTWFANGTDFIEYRRAQSKFVFHLRNPESTNILDKGVFEIINSRGAVIAGSHQLQLRVGASSYNVGIDVLTILTNQNVGIGTTTPENAFEVKSTTKGSSPFPVMTKAQRDSLNAKVGELVYQSDTVGVELEGLYLKKSTGWKFGI